MESSVVESTYPLSFRQEDVEKLSQHLRNRHNIDIVGMKRVGISNFLRFFLHKKGLGTSALGDDKKHIFILVDLNDLIERELFPFWTLTLKRIVDASQKLALSPEKKKRIENLFVTSIQSQDLFLLIDSVRESLVILYEAGFTPTIFLLRFDRIKDVVTSTFLSNLQGLRDATNQELCFVFTSYRTLEELLSTVVSKADLRSFSQQMYLLPASCDDMHIVFEQYKKKYHISLSLETEDELFRLISGNVQYLQLAVIVLSEQKKVQSLSNTELLSLLSQDERITLYTEEIWESLTNEEQEIVRKIMEGKVITEEEKKKNNYVWLSGMIHSTDKEHQLFSKLFLQGIHEQAGKSESSEEIHLSKKEQLLIDVLISHKDDICERETIIEKVWPEYQAFGVSDWAIDRLVARVRNKLKKQQSPLEIKTIRTRGYKLTESK